MSGPSITCSVEECANDVLNVSRQLCQRHYTAYVRHGDPTVNIPDGKRRIRQSVDADGIERRACSVCDLRKPLIAFYADTKKGAQIWRRTVCRTCYQEAGRRRWATRPDDMRVNRRRSTLKRSYGITLEEYAEMLSDQSGRCALCGDRPPTTKVLAVDHDHETGRVRGLLCGPCNTALNRAEIPGWTQAVTAYLAEALRAAAGPGRAP